MTIIEERAIKFLQLGEIQWTGASAPSIQVQWWVVPLPIFWGIDPSKIFALQRQQLRAQYILIQSVATCGDWKDVMTCHLFAPPGSFQIASELQEHRVSCESQLADIRTFASFCGGKSTFFVLWHAFFKCSLGERINKKMNEKFVAILLRYREQPRPSIYIYIYLYLCPYIY